MIREMEGNIQDWYSIETRESGFYSKDWDYICLICGNKKTYKEISQHVESHGLIVNHSAFRVDCKIRHIG